MASDQEIAGPMPARLPSFWPTHILFCDPFPGSPEVVTSTDNRIAVVWTRQRCSLCLGNCNPRTLIRETAFRLEGQDRPLTFCWGCCRAMAWAEGWPTRSNWALNRRRALGLRRAQLWGLPYPCPSDMCTSPTP